MIVTCDRCGPGVAATKTFVLAQSGLELSFCGHCSDRNAATLIPLTCDVRVLVAAS